MNLLIISSLMLWVLTLAGTGVFEVSAVNEKCVRVYGIVMRVLQPMAEHDVLVYEVIDHELLAG